MRSVIVREKPRTSAAIGTGSAAAGDTPVGAAPAARIMVQAPGDPTAVRVAEPVTVGMPFPLGFCADERHLDIATRLCTKLSNLSVAARGRQRLNKIASY